MAANDARPVPRKNVAWRVYFAIRKNDGTLITSWTGQDSEESLDGGSFTDCANEATEIGTSGCGYLDLTAAEMNADAVTIKITVTNTGALPIVLTVFPEEAGDYRLSATPPTAAETASQVRTELATELARIDATIGSRLASASYVSPATPTDVSDAQAAILAKLPSALVGGRIDASVGAYQSGLTPLQPLVAGRQIAVSETTGKVTAEAVELDSTTQAQLLAIEEDSAAAVGYLTTLVGRLTANAATAIQNLFHMITGTGAASKYTAGALENAPAGGAGGGLTAEQDETLTGIAVKLAGTPVEVVSRVADGGNIVAYVGDDFRVRSDSSLTITVSDPAGGLFTRLEAIGAENLAFGAMLDARNRITGTVADLSQSGSGASQLLLVQVELSEAGTFCKVSDDYVWQIESTQEHDSEEDTLIEIEGTLSLRRNVVS